jgi:hypothetical protein
MSGTNLDYSSTVAEIERLDQEAKDARTRAEEYVREHPCLQPAEAAAKVIDGFMEIEIVDEDEDPDSAFRGFRVSSNGYMSIRYHHVPASTTTREPGDVSDDVLKDAIKHLGGSEFTDQPLAEVREHTAERRDMAALVPDEVSADE